MLASRVLSRLVEGFEVAGWPRPVVRLGHGPPQTRVGPVEVRRAKVRDRGNVRAAEKSAHLVDPAEVGADKLLPLLG